MNAVIRVAGAGLAAVLIGGSLYILNLGARLTNEPLPTSAVAPKEQSAAGPSPVATPWARPIRDGSYSAVIPVAKILEMLEEDSTLTSGEKSAIINRALRIHGATRLRVVFVLRDERFMLFQSVDSEALRMSTPAPWMVVDFDGRTMTFDTGSDDGFAEQRFAIEGGIAFGYALRPVSPAANDVATFVRRTLFLGAPFYGP